MAASHRRRIESQESGIKYFVLGGFSSAFFLYGIAMVYGTAGSTNFTKIVDSFNANVPAVRHDAFILAGVALLLVGLGFKVAAVPFHFWTPDVYQGAPTPVTSFMASVGKVAAFAAMLRVLIYALPHWRDDYRPIVWALAVVTVVVGSVMAVVQTNVKRMLAFSSISHAGFILVGVEAASHHRRSTRLRQRRVRGAAVPVAVRGVGDRHVRRRHHGRPHRRQRHRSGVVPRARQGASGALAGHDGAAARPGRRAVDVGLRRQVRCDPGGGRRAQLRDRHHRDGRRR